MSLMNLLRNGVIIMIDSKVILSGLITIFLIFPVDAGSYGKGKNRRVADDFLNFYESWAEKEAAADPNYIPFKEYNSETEFPIDDNNGTEDIPYDYAERIYDNGQMMLVNPDGSLPRPFDAINLFEDMGDLGRDITLKNPDENKIWFDRMLRGEIGRDRFLVLCALKDGQYHEMDDVRNFMDFKMPGEHTVKTLYKKLILMAGRSRYNPPGEGWLEKGSMYGKGESTGIHSMWRIEPSVLPMLYFLLITCPEDDTCTSIQAGF